MTPSPIDLSALRCPACDTPLDDDRDGTACSHCGGLLVPRVFAERLFPARGKPALPPVMPGAAPSRRCPGCAREMGAVLCHGIAAWSCGRCRWLFFEGARRHQLGSPDAAPPVPAGRQVLEPSLLSVIADRAREAPSVVREALGVIVLATLVIGAMFLELRP